jgi:hypothetical protein
MDTAYVHVSFVRRSKVYGQPIDVMEFQHVDETFFACNEFVLYLFQGWCRQWWMMCRGAQFKHRTALKQAETRAGSPSFGRSGGPSASCSYFVDPEFKSELRYRIYWLQSLHRNSGILVDVIFGHGQFLIIISDSFLTNSTAGRCVIWSADSFG